MKAVSQYGNPLRVWDEGDFDGYGLYVYAESLGVLGIVRAASWEDAWSCVVDEIMHDADPNDSTTYARDYDETAAEGDLAEGVHFRGSGVPSNDGLNSHLASEDLNGSELIGPLTADQVKELSGITVSFGESD